MNRGTTSSEQTFLLMGGANLRTARTMEKCHLLSFSEKEVLLAFTEAQLKRGPDLLKAFCDEDSDLRILGNGEKPYAEETV
ncbi:unnamed protein product [Cladocopium goreaui]|uniref:Uncharacterized protein n=1 Tax=Cladocopium goreaui TaxID=2562237 RepID=A0A9P1C5F4_9DINO|nr:unnamed protein product [Cladocopium goreaui]